jgi:hypothetical protein
MAATQSCAVCRHPMDANERGDFHIKNQVTKAEKHAHADCVRREPTKAKIGRVVRRDGDAT